MFASYTWTVDIQDPNTLFTTPPPAFTNLTATFTFTIDDENPGPGTGLLKYECRVDSEVNWTNCTTPRTLSNLSQGSHTFRVRAYDKAGNFDGSAAQHTWQVDRTAPTLTVTDPITTSASSDVTFTFSASDALSGLNRTQCKVDTGTFMDCTSPFQATVTDGNHTFQFRAIDNVGNVFTSATYPVEVDTAQPDTDPIIANVPPITNATGATFTLSGNDGGTPLTKFECRLDAGAWQNCTSPRSYAGLSAGTHTFRARAKDKANNVDLTEEIFTWTIDLTNPTGRVVSPGGQSVYINRPTATFVYTGSDNLSQASNLTFECRLTSTTFEPCNDPNTTVPNLPEARQVFYNLTEGQRTFEVRVKDEATNTQIITKTVFVDFTEPDTQLLGVQPNPTNNRNPSFTFTGSDFFTAAANLTFECSLDAMPWIPCTSGTVQFTNTTDFTHTFQVRALDQAGNFDTTPSSFTWRVDLGRPDTEIFGTVPVSMTKDTTAGFQFRGSDTLGGSGLVAFECQLNTNAWTICSSPRTFGGLVSGNYTFRVRARDRAGNVDDTPAEHNWIIDIVPPSAPTISTPTANAVNKLLFSFSAQDNTDGSGIRGYQCSLTTGSQPDAWVPCASPYTPPGTFADGTYTFKVRAIDRLDNIGAPTSKTITFDATAPVVQLTASPALTVTKSVNATFVFTTTAPGTPRAGEVVTVACKRDGVTVSPCTSPRSQSGFNDGLHTFRVDASDDLGNTSATTITWRVDTQAPQATFDPQNSPLFRNDPTPTLTFSWNDGANGSGVAGFKCLLDGTLIWPCGQSLGGTNWVFTPTTVLTDGVHSLQIIPVDYAGNQGTGGGAPTYTWTLETQDPDTVLISRQPSELLVAASSVTFTFALTGTDTGPMTFECSFTSGPWQPCASPYTIDDLPTGFYTFAVRAKDQAGNVDETPPSTFWTVDRTGPTVSLTSTPPKASNSPAATFVFTATDNLNGSGFASAKCRIDDGDWAACNPSGVTFTGLEEGSYTFHVQAFDQLGNAGAAITYSWVVDLTAPETAFIGALPDRIAVQQLTLQFTGTDTLTADGMKLECSLDNRPFEDCLSPRTFLGLTNGPHNLRVRARDGAGNIDPTPAQHSWIVEVPNPQQSIFLPLVKK
ncbi:MAG: hypothetical protein OHK0022_45610 [Roseiflexaceae bacterium]